MVWMWILLHLWGCHAYTCSIDCPEDSIDFLDQKLGKMLHTSDATTTEQGQGEGQEQERQEPALPAKQKSWADMVEDEEGAEEEDILW